MKCPTCGERTPDDWKTFAAPRRVEGGYVQASELDGGQPNAKAVSLDWMHCANEDCNELVIRIHERFYVAAEGGPEAVETASWIARPRTAKRPIDPLIPDDIKRDYNEAAGILDVSPRMSAVLSGRILADVLERYARLTDFSLAKRINQFIADTTHPRPLRENLHYLREIRDFSAHSQTDDQMQIIDVSREEAAWTLDVIDRLLDYLVLTPERDRRIRQTWDKKLESAERKPIQPLPDDPPANEPS